MLSEAALALLRLHAERDGVPLTEANRPLHRELAGEGLMIPVHSFREGREAFYRLTETGWKLAGVLARMSSAPSLGGSAAPPP